LKKFAKATDFAKKFNAANGAFFKIGGDEKGDKKDWDG